jgi:ADP-ribose pyrophosphatase
MSGKTEKTVYDGKLFKVSQEEIFDAHGHKHVIEKCTRPDVVTIIGLQEDKKILLIKEFRPGSNSYVFWLPGGKIGSNENPEAAARREFEEETQHTANQYELFHTKYPSDSFIGNGFVFLAQDIRPGSKSQPDESGDIWVVPTEINEAIQMTLRGLIPNEFFCFLLVKLREQLG